MVLDKKYSLLTCVILIIQRKGKWEHLVEVYEQNRSEDGLVLLPKLRYEHVNLNNFSKMRVDLAAQVIAIVVILSASLSRH